MPQPKKHRNAAERQAAYRQRQSKPPTQARLANLARSVAGIIRVSAADGTCAVPNIIADPSMEQTLRNLICWLTPEKDTVAHPDWNKFHPDRAHERDIFDEQ